MSIRPRPRPTFCLSFLCAALALTGGCALPPETLAASGSNGSALSELTQGGQATPTTTSTTTTPARTKSTSESGTSTASSSISNSVLILALVAAGLLLGGIAFVILRDARRVAPVPDGQSVERSGRDPAVMMRKRRAKAKAARRQRKRNR